ncbi:MAG: GAF domain-containing protein [Candidatus Bathyarchaeota archaeon]|nr:GAF domain-containing protein [Candidatus Bathyarchaeota archaeon]
MKTKLEKNFIAEEVCNPATCQKHCPRVDMWKNMFSSEKMIHSLGRKRTVDLTIKKMVMELGLSGCAMKILKDEESNEFEITSSGNNYLKQHISEIEEKAVLQDSSIMLELESGFSIIATPISFGVKNFGALYSYVQSKEFPREALEIIDAVAECVGVALENERKYKIVLKNWHEAIDELWRSIDVWKNPTPPQSTIRCLELGINSMRSNKELKSAINR